MAGGILVAFVVHPTRPDAAAVAKLAQEVCLRRGARHITVDVWSDCRPCREQAAELSERPDLVVTIGGDGTLLRGLDLAVEADAPVLGVNAGRVGFLSPFDPEEL